MANRRPLILTWRVPFPQALAEADLISARGPSPLFLRLDNAPMPDMPTFLRIRNMGSILLTVEYRFGHEPYTDEELQAAVDQAIAYANAMDDTLWMPEAADEGGCHRRAQTLNSPQKSGLSSCGRSIARTRPTERLPAGGGNDVCIHAEIGCMSVACPGDGQHVMRHGAPPTRRLVRCS